jgi:hypothetical protein
MTTNADARANRRDPGPACWRTWPCGPGLARRSHGSPPGCPRARVQPRRSRLRAPAVTFRRLPETAPVFSPVIPDEHDHATGLEHSCELLPRCLRLEPVKRLPGGDEVRAALGQRRLRRPSHALEPAMTRKQTLASMPHLLVRLDHDDAVAVVQEQPGKDARPRPHVRDHGALRQTALAPQKVE